MASEIERNDILRLLSAKVLEWTIHRFILELAKSTTTWKDMCKRKIQLETISSMLIKHTTESNLLPESLPLSLIQLKSLLSVPKNMVRELFISLANILNVLPVHPQDGSLEHLPINSPKSSKNLNYWSLLILNPINKLLLKHHMLTYLPSLSATQMLPWTLSM